MAEAGSWMATSGGGVGVGLVGPTVWGVNGAGSVMGSRKSAGEFLDTEEGAHSSLGPGGALGVEAAEAGS